MLLSNWAQGIWCSAKTVICIVSHLLHLLMLWTFPTFRKCLWQELLIGNRKLTGNWLCARYCVFLDNKYGNYPVSVLKSVISNFYREDEIVSAKLMLVQAIDSSYHTSLNTYLRQRIDWIVENRVERSSEHLNIFHIASFWLSVLLEFFLFFQKVLLSASLQRFRVQAKMTH